MSTIYYPGGGSLTSTALTRKQIETAFQQVTAQSLGLLTDPITMTGAIVSGQLTISVPTLNQLYEGLLVVGEGLPDNTLITGFIDGNVAISNAATETGSFPYSFSDPNVWATVRIGWQQQGQPGPSISSDTVAVYCNPVKKEYSNMRDVTTSGTDTTVTQTDVYTRCWRTSWVFYGPDALDNARAVRSALMTQQFTVDFLSALNLYIKADVEEPDSFPENFQGQWWERADLSADFNEQINETWTVGTVGSVEVKVYSEDGLQNDFIATE